MGYVVNEAPPTIAGTDRQVVNIQAIVLWSANSFDLGGYEKSFDQRKSNKLHS